MGWDLGDLYRDRLSLRQFWVRLKALPPDAPLVFAIRRSLDEAEAEDKVRDVEDALAMFGR